MIWEKESPRWLSEKGRWDEARAVIARLAQKPIDHPDVVQEADEIRADLEQRIKPTFAEQWREITSSKKMFYRCSLPFIMYVTRSILVLLFLTISTRMLYVSTSILSRESHSDDAFLSLPS